MPLTILQQARTALHRRVPVVIGVALDSLLPELPVGTRLAVIDGDTLLSPDLPEPIAATILREAKLVWDEEDPRFVSFVAPTLARLLLEPVIDPRLLDRLIDGQRPCALVTDLTSGLKTIVRETEVEGQLGLEPHELSAARTILAAGLARPLGADLFVEVVR